jgi:hypothetical protein
MSLLLARARGAALRLGRHLRQRAPMKNPWVALAPWIAMLALLVASHLCVNRGAVDDLSVMYANSWLETCQPGEALPGVLHSHLERYGPALSTVSQTRYSLRLDILGHNYPLLSLLLRGAARVGASGLWAVVGALLLQHVCVAAAVMALVRRKPWVMLALIVSAVPALALWPLDVGSFGPFQRVAMTWLCTMPRGATVLAWFGALVAVLFSSGRRRFAIAAGFAALAFACHRSMALLCFASTLPPLGLWLGLRSRLAERVRPVPLVALFVAIVLAVAGAKLALLVHYDSPTLSPLIAGRRGSSAPLARSISTLIAWGLWSIGGLLAWLRARATPSLDARLRRSGDALAALLFVVAAVALGATTVQADNSLWYGPLFFVSEGCNRLGALANLLFFAVAGLTLHVLRPALLPRCMVGAAAFAVALSALQFFVYVQPVVPEAAPPLSALLRRGAHAYKNETEYFLSVAHQVASRGCSPP